MAAQYRTIVADTHDGLVTSVISQTANPTNKFSFRNIPVMHQESPAIYFARIIHEHF
jgi:hypothetical protein